MSLGYVLVSRTQLILLLEKHRTRMYPPTGGWMTPTHMICPSTWERVTLLSLRRGSTLE
jgi:hypothetical protein